MKKLLPVIPIAFLISFFVFPACQKELSVENDSTFLATGSLRDSFGICLPDTVIGTFYNGITPGSDTAYVQIQVNVTTAGTYTITTDQQNGFLFSSSGFFSSTGINIVILRPIGTPILPIPTDFTVVFDTSSCTFTVNVQDSTGTGLGGTDTTGIALNTWQFRDDSATYSGPVTSAIFDTSVSNELSLTGNVQSGTDSIIFMRVTFPTTAITPGTYTTGVDNSFLFSTIFGDIIYNADASTLPDAIDIVITSYNDITKEVAATFSGKTKDSAGNTVVITNGAFRATVQ